MEEEKSFKLFGAHRCDGKPDDCVITHVSKDGKITYEVQGNFAALMIAAINHANENKKFRSELGQLAVTTEMTNGNISPEEAFKKIQQIKPISAHTDESKKILKSEILCGLHDPMNSKLNLVTYEDTSVDIQLEGNKAGMIVNMLSLAQNNPEAIEGVMDTLNKIADINLQVHEDGGMGNCVVVSGEFHDVLNEMLSKEDLTIKAIGLRKLVEQIENQDHILEFLTRVKNEPDFPHKDEILSYATDKFRIKFSSGASC